jgi:hypothetical protein
MTTSDTETASGIADEALLDHGIEDNDAENGTETASWKVATRCPELSEKSVNRQRLSRPSLKITRAESDGHVFEVWNPFIGNYQPIGSILDAMQRVDELAGLIGQMWLQRHPKQSVLADVPDVDRTDGIQWAEFRVNATTHRSYDTRRFDRPGWMRAGRLTQAAEATCTKVGYALPTPNAS